MNKMVAKNDSNKGFHSNTNEDYSQKSHSNAAIILF